MSRWMRSLRLRPAHLNRDQEPRKPNFRVRVGAVSDALRRRVLTMLIPCVPSAEAQTQPRGPSLEPVGSMLAGDVHVGSAHEKDTLAFPRFGRGEKTRRDGYTVSGIVRILGQAV